MRLHSLSGSGLLGVAISALLLSGCNTNGNDDNHAAVVPPTRTVLVYMVGSDLESQGAAATADLAEMMQVGSSKGFNIVVETGGANKPGWNTVKRQLVNAGSMTSLADLGAKNMGDSATLQDFIAWGMKTYPADKYTLVFWDHGGGAVGDNGTTVGIDEVHGDGLSLPEIRTALQNSAGVAAKRFDLVGFDTCLMATLETAKIIANHADYMVASEETEPGSGWDYKSWLGALKSQPSMNTLDIGKTIVNSYFNSFAAADPQSRQITLSAIQLNKVSALTTAVGKLAQKVDGRLVAAPDSTRLEVAIGRSRSESYGKQHGDDAGMVDLNDFAGRLPAVYAAEANVVKTALAEAVVYSRRAAERPNASGLSIYLPSETTIRTGLAPALAAYKQVQFDNGWEGMVERYATAAAADVQKPLLSNETMTGNTLSVDVDITGGSDINAVNVYLTHDNGNGTLLVLSREEADSFTGGKASYDFDNKILLVNGQYVYTDVLEADEDNGLYTLGAPAMINGNQATLVIQAQVNGTNIDLTVVGQIPDSANGVVSRMMALKTGDHIDPLFLNFDTATGNTSLVTQSGNDFTLTAAGATAAIGQLPADNYVAFFAVQDYAGNMQYSNAFNLTVNP